VLTKFDNLQNLRRFAQTADVIDDSSDGLALQADVAHNDFDRFGWSLQEAKVCFLLWSILLVLADKQSKDSEPGRLSNLGTSQQRRFERFGKLDDIEDSISNL
jgi:hypothetical protein